MKDAFPEQFGFDETEQKNIWENGHFVFDANVLLNFYRLSVEHRESTMQILTKIKSRVFLPHQVAFEFFRNRDDAIGEQVVTANQLRAALKRTLSVFQEEWSKTNRHRFIPYEDMSKQLVKSIEAMLSKIDQLAQQYPPAFDQNDDPVLTELNNIFSGRVQAVPDDAEEKELVAKVNGRIQANEAPCFTSDPPKKNAEKNPHRGDGRVWFQIVDYAKHSNVPIIFVTADEQENWWRLTEINGEKEILGPRPRLIKDVRDEANVGLLMFTQMQFLRVAPKYVADVPDQSGTIGELQRIEKQDHFLRSVARLQDDIARRSGALDIEKLNALSETLRRSSYGIDMEKLSALSETLRRSSYGIDMEKLNELTEMAKNFGFPPRGAYKPVTPSPDPPEEES